MWKPERIEPSAGQSPSGIILVRRVWKTASRGYASFSTDKRLPIRRRAIASSRPVIRPSITFRPAMLSADAFRVNPAGPDVNSKGRRSIGRSLLTDERPRERPGVIVRHRSNF